MAYSTLVSLERTIDQFLNHNQFSISPHEKKHIISLDKYVITLRAFLEEFPEKAKSLEARMRNVAMEAEDVIELYMTEKIHYNIRYTHWIAELRRFKFIFQLRRIKDQMDSIAGEVVEIKNRIIIKDAQLDDSVGASPSSSQGGEASKIDMVGLNKDLLEIKTWLCEDSRQLKILPITGMGGIGKTTLARNAYDDPLIMEHFDIRVWVTISQDYSEERILSNIFDSLKEFVLERERGNISMAVKVYQILVGRRFLIVLDDMWSAKALDDTRQLFPDNNNGSRILLTTRLRDFAAYANSSTPSHEMRLMDPDQSWNLLREKVFGRQDSILPELEAIGRDIARSCGGLPLAVVVAAGLLSTVSKTQTSWEEIAENVKSSLATIDAQIEKILSLSYNNLPHHLRACFLYMGGFPEDQEIKVENLIRLWIAEGFVKPVAFKSFEDRAEEYLEDLIRRNLIIVSNNKLYGKIKSCRLHDLVRDLCIKLSQEEKFIVHVKGRKLLKSMKDERRISVSNFELDSFANIFSTTIRTILYFQFELGSFGSSFRLLRVLDVLRVGFHSPLLPDQFFELFHLRYLAFCYSSGRIPRALSNLQSLQTIIIQRSFYRSLWYRYLDPRMSREKWNIPCEIWNMPQLRHLIILNCQKCYFADPSGASFALNNLQTLGKVTNLVCSLSLLHMIPNLRKLSITYSWGFGELLFHNLVHLHQLEKLKLETEGCGYNNSAAPNLLLPTSLKKLTLIGWGSYSPYLKILGPLPNLEVLKLRKFKFMEQEWVTSDTDFPKLKFLLIDNSDLKQWNSEGSHFPLLEHLLIHSCWSLCEIPYSMGEIPTLKLIEVKGCENSVADSVKLIQEEQLSCGDDVFQVRC